MLLLFLVVYLEPYQNLSYKNCTLQYLLRSRLVRLIIFMHYNSFLIRDVILGAPLRKLKKWEQVDSNPTWQSFQVLYMSFKKYAMMRSWFQQGVRTIFGSGNLISLVPTEKRFLLDFSTSNEGGKKV